MSITTFLSNETLWQALAARIKTAHHVDAAIAFFGQGGAKLLPLRKGDRFIVDMSSATVRAGGTDPREVETLIQGGVQVFTRRHLHAKIVVADKAVISGSANVSKRSQQLLDEAAIITTDPATVRRAREFIDRLCTEPVRPEYLQKCKELYRPPRFSDGRGSRGPEQGQQRVKHAKLWVVGGLREWTVPDIEKERYEEGEAKAEKKITDKDRSKPDSFSWSSKPKMASELEFGDWIIQVTTYKDKSIVVSPPEQFLFSDHYLRDAGKERWVFHCEAPKRGETMGWETFRRAANSLLGPDSFTSPRLKAVRDIQVADGLLALWTPSGRIAERKGKK